MNVKKKTYYRLVKPNRHENLQKKSVIDMTLGRLSSETHYPNSTASDRLRFRNEVGLIDATDGCDCPSDESVFELLHAPLCKRLEKVLNEPKRE